MAALAIGGCHQNLTMSDQKKLAEWERSSIFRNGRVLQAPPAGSVSREAEIGNVLAARPPMTLALVKRGHERFDVFCSECHGYGGDADGMVVQRGFPRPPSFHEARLIAAPDAYFVEVITQGTASCIPMPTAYRPPIAGRSPLISVRCSGRAQ